MTQIYMADGQEFSVRETAEEILNQATQLQRHPARLSSPTLVRMTKIEDDLPIYINLDAVAYLADGEEPL
jgi:hypothetical protein